MRLRTISIAETDMAEIAAWLDEQQPGRGEDFLAAVEEAFAKIRQMPLACSTMDLPKMQKCPQLRWLAAGPFPYLVIFQSDQNEIVVVAVLQPHRDLESILRSRIGSQ